MLNENRKTSNYARCLKSKKAQPSEQKEKTRTEKGSNTWGDNKKQEIKKYKTCVG